MGTAPGYATRTAKKPYRAIGDEGLEGCKFYDMICVRGPCGQEHTMSRRAAAQLRDWLDEVLGGSVTIDGTVLHGNELVRR